MFTKPYVEYASSAKRQRSMRVITFIVFLVPILILFLHNHRRSLPPSLYLKPCGRIVLVTAARHGSTWFISCAEGCPSVGKRRFAVPNSHTELWVDHNGRRDIVKDLTPESAVDYVRRNTSLKIMRVAAKREDELRKFFALLDNSVPVFVLRRNLEDAYSSLLEARETHVWMRNKANLEDRITTRKIVKNEEFFSYSRSMNKFFDKISTLMREVGVVWDEIDYDDAVRSRIIVAEKQRCYLTNCNYL